MEKYAFMCMKQVCRCYLHSTIFFSILGEERHNILDSQLNLTLIFTEMQTLHLSPLSGRYDTSEKPYEVHKQHEESRAI